MRADKFKIAIAYWIGWFICICFIFYYDTIDEYRDTEKVKAVVVSKLVGIGRHRSAYEYPQFRFDYKDSSYLFAKRKGFFISTYDIGDKATAIFPKGQPGKAEVYLFLPYWVSLSKLFFSFMISAFLFVIPVFYKWYGDFKKQYPGR